jgi:hypothetical protein
MVGISGNILPWIDHLLFKVLRSRPKINLSMLIKKKKKIGDMDGEEMEGRRRDKIKYKYKKNTKK